VNSHYSDILANGVVGWFHFEWVVKTGQVITTKEEEINKRAGLDGCDAGNFKMWAGFSEISKVSVRIAAYIFALKSS